VGYSLSCYLKLGFAGGPIWRLMKDCPELTWVGLKSNGLTWHEQNKTIPRGKKKEKGCGQKVIQK